MARSNEALYCVSANSRKVTVDGTDEGGKPTPNGWTGKFDGNDYPVTGDPNTDTRSYKKIDGRTLELTDKKDGKVVITGRIVASAKSTALYDEQ